MIFQQLSGIIIAVQYGPTLIENAGFATDDVDQETAAVVLSLPLSVVRVLGTYIALQVVDTRGRRRILLRTIPILSLAMFIIAASIWLNENFDQNSFFALIGKWAALLFMTIFLFTYSSGMSVIPWLINSEIYPIFLIGSASALSAFLNWQTNFIMTSIFEKTNKVVSIGVTGGISILAWIFVYYFIKETKGNSIRRNVALMMNKTLKESNILM